MQKSEVYNIDCLEYMKGLPNNSFGLCVADPPYGLDKKSTQGSGKLKNRTLNKHDMTWVLWCRWRDNRNRIGQNQWQKMCKSDCLR